MSDSASSASSASSANAANAAIGNSNSRSEHPPHLTQPAISLNYSAVSFPDHMGELDIVYDSSWDFRPGQRELAERVANSKKKIVFLEAECGAGKSIIPIAAAAAAGVRATVLIQTLNLQEQYLRDFKHAKMIMGRAHSKCNLTGKPASYAPCVSGARCSLRGGWTKGGQPIGMPECEYFRRKAEAALSKLSIQNYAYWLGETVKGQGTFASNDWLICDEGHELDQILMASATVELRLPEIKSLGVPMPKRDANPDELHDWAEEQESLVNRMVKAFSSYDEHFDAAGASAEELLQAAANVENFQKAARLDEAIKVILKDVHSEDWVVDYEMQKIILKPIYGKYGFRHILAGARYKVVIMSAYLGPELLMNSLGLDPDDVEVIKAPPIYDRDDSPVLYCPIRKYGYRTSEKEWKHLSKSIDRFHNHFAAARKLKGLVHVPSLKLRDTILKGSLLKMAYVAYDSSGARERKYGPKDVAIKKFVNARGRSILIGQSVSTGLDLPGTIQYQIIPKLWFAPTIDPAIERRMAVDKSFYIHHTICQIVQAVGRLKRKPEDSGPTIILDASFGWFYAANRDHFPDWFKNALVYDGWTKYPDIKKGVLSDEVNFGLRN